MVRFALGDFIHKVTCYLGISGDYISTTITLNAGFMSLPKYQVDLKIL